MMNDGMIITTVINHANHLNPANHGSDKRKNSDVMS